MGEQSQIILKENYGWSKEKEEFFLESISLGDDMRNCSFQIKSVSGKRYWYFRYYTNEPYGRRKDKYVCAVGVNPSNNSESFQKCCKILLDKLKAGGIKTSIPDSRLLRPYLDEYIQTLEQEKSSRGGRRVNTIDRLIRNLNDFRKFIDKKKLKLKDVPHSGMRQIFHDYIRELSERDKIGKQGKLAKETIKIYANGVRFFLDYLTKIKEVNGLELFEYHPITANLQREIIDNIVCDRVDKPQPIFKMEYYEILYKFLVKEIKTRWNYFCKHGKWAPVYDSRGKVNQPPQPLGGEFIYFIALLQLRYGFRISEVLLSYRSETDYKEKHLPNHSKEMASYWIPTNDGWNLQIVNSKKRNRLIPVNDTISSKFEPPKDVRFDSVVTKKGNRKYITSLVDIIFNVFPVSAYTFSSPNTKKSPDSPRSVKYAMNIFKDRLVKGENWAQYGIQSSHDLRSFFVSYMIRREDITPMQVAEITGHTLGVMEKFYLRENLESKIITMAKVDQKLLLRKSATP